MIIASTLTAEELAFIHLVLSKTTTKSSRLEAIRTESANKIARMRQRLLAAESAAQTEKASRQVAEKEASVYTYPAKARGYASPQLRSNTLKSDKPKAGSLEFAEKERLVQLDAKDLLGELGL